MFEQRLTLFKLFGTAVRVDPSWIFVLALAVWSLGVAVFPTIYPGLPRTTHWWMAAAGAIGMFVSVVVHEAGHLATARRGGAPGAVTLLIFGGMDEDAAKPPTPRAAIVSASCGWLFTSAMTLLLLGIEQATVAGRYYAAVGLVQFLASYNVALLLVNLLPAYPFDGGRIVRAILWKKHGSWSQSGLVVAASGSFVGYAFILVGGIRVFTGGLVDGLWLLLIGIFLRGAASRTPGVAPETPQAVHEPVSRVMRPHAIAVPRAITIAEFVERYVAESDIGVFPVVGDDAVVGCVTARDIWQVGRDDWPKTSIDAIAKPWSDANSTSADTPSIEVLRRMGRAETSSLLVVDGGEFRGIVTMCDLVRHAFPENEPPQSVATSPDLDTQS